MKKTLSFLFVLVWLSMNAVLAQSDNPCDAPALTPGTACGFITGNLPATATSTPAIPTPGCANYNGQDVWYKVVVPASGNLTIDLNKVTASLLVDMGMALYAAETCTGPFTLIECDNNDSNYGLMPKIERTGLTVGSTIWIRLWEHGGNVTGNFQICAYSPVPCTGGSNNTCATSSPFCTGVPLDYCNTTGVLSAGTYDCLQTTPNPMWLHFQVSTPGNIDVLIQQHNTNGGLIDVDFALYGPFSDLTAACSSIVPSSDPIDCSYSSSGMETANITNAQVGEFYMMLITNYSNNPGSIQFTQTGGNGATNCDLIFPCSVTATMVSDTCSSGVGKVTAVAGNGLAPYTYNWNSLGNQTTETVNNVSPGIHTVTMTTSDGCTATASVTVTDITPTASGSATPVSCPGGNNGTATANMINPAGTVSYLWNDPAGQTTQTATGLMAGTYICTMTSSAGCTITQTVTVSEIPGMVANIASQQNPTCHNGNDGVMSVTVTQGTAPYTYQWSNSTSTMGTANDLMEGLNTVTIQDALGCLVSRSVTLTDPPPVKINFITPDSTICPGSSMDITANVIDGKAPYTYWWSSNGTSVGSEQSVNVTPENSGTLYCITAKDACGDLADSCMTISFPDPIIPNIVPDKEFDCQPATFTFSNNSTPADQVATTLFTLGNGLDTLVQGTGSVSGLYTDAHSYTVDVKITSMYGCVYTKSFPGIVESIALPMAAFAISLNPTTMFETTVKMINNSSAGVANWNWNAPDASPVSSTSENPTFHFPEGLVGQYPIQLIVMTPEGCKDTVTNILNVNSDILFFAPNAFTPNGDEYNQSWKIYTQGIDIHNFQLSIFNRWGEMIWESHNPNEPWDGTYAGNIVQDGIYTWKASIKDIHSDYKKEYSGVITIIR